jgi:hypothetical protein
MGGSNGEFADRGRVGNRRYFQSTIRDFMAHRGRRQQRVSQPVFDEAGENPEGIGLHLDIELQFHLRRRMLDKRPEPMRMTRQNQPLAQQPSNLDLLFPRQSAATRPHGHDLVTTETPNGQVQIDRWPVDNRKVYLPAVQPFDEMSAVAFHDAQRDAGVALDGPSREPRRNHTAHGRNEPQHHPSGRWPSRGLDVVANLIDLPDDARRPREKQTTSLRQHHAAAIPGKELGAQFMLEKLDLTTERRLRYPQGVGGFSATQLNVLSCRKSMLANLGMQVNTL